MILRILQNMPVPNMSKLWLYFGTPPASRSKKLDQICWILAHFAVLKWFEHDKIQIFNPNFFWVFSLRDRNKKLQFFSSKKWIIDPESGVFFVGTNYGIEFLKWKILSIQIWSKNMFSKFVEICWPNFEQSSKNIFFSESVFWTFDRIFFLVLNVINFSLILKKYFWILKIDRHFFEFSKIWWYFLFFLNFQKFHGTIFFWIFKNLDLDFFSVLTNSTNFYFNLKTNNRPKENLFPFSYKIVT